MLSQQELYNQAMREISARRQIARTLADETQRTLEQTHPALAKANHAIRAAGVQMSLATLTGQDPDEAKKNLQAARNTRDSILAQSGRAPTCLEPKFNCTVCCDTGLADGKVCKCVHALMRDIRRAEISSTSSLSITKFDTMEYHYYPNKVDVGTGINLRHYMQTLLQDLNDYAKDFDRNSSNLLLVGNSGLGKTHAALAIAGIALEKGFDVIYLSSPDFFATLENHHFNNRPEEERALLHAVKEADLLILDDLGTELVSAFTISTLYSLLNHRTANHAPIIFTSNIIDSAIFEKRYTEKISSRLSGACEPFHFIGEDIRALKYQEE